MVANELGVDLKLHPVDVKKGEQKQEAHLARHVWFHSLEIIREREREKERDTYQYYMKVIPFFFFSAIWKSTSI